MKQSRKLLILSRNKSLHSVQRIILEAKKRKLEAIVVDPIRCQLLIEGNIPRVYVRGKLLENISMVLPRIGTSITEYGLLVVRQFESMGIPSVNSSDAILNSRNKFRSLQACAKAGLAVPSSAMSRNPTDIKFLIRKLRPFPMIMKLLQGSQGVGVMLGSDPSSIESITATCLQLEKDLILQKFIRESAGRDIRVFVVNGKVIAAMRRVAKRGDFRANVHRGGWGEHIKQLPKNYEKLAIQATAAVGLNIAGVDLIETTLGPMVLEINSSPGFEELEKATRVNVAKAIVDMALLVEKKQKRK
ncbi:MAG: RimK family alpha-L-glutamate ligase [Oligoflexia bacterium]|nr:RimK family alpha-L-glutamate ligase [Oligoflexia bacterium]